MTLVVGKISTSHIGMEKVNRVDHSVVICSISKSFRNIGLKHTPKRVEYMNLSSKWLGTRLCFVTDGFILTNQKSHGYDAFGLNIVPCVTCSGETKKCPRQSKNFVKKSRGRIEDTNAGSHAKLNSHKTRLGNGPRKSITGLADACNFVYNDAKFVNEKARNDIVLLSRGIRRLNNRARQDVEVLGNEFLKLDARARKDTEKIDSSMKKKAARLHHMATTLKDRAQYTFKTAADKHWSDGALEADLRRADVIARRRAMEDAFMALKFVKDIHDMMVNKQLPKDGSLSVGDLMGYITLERNGQVSDHFPGDISTDRIAAIQEAYWSMASALSEADGIDYTDPEELELLVATLIDLDAMDGKRSVSLLAECSISPDVNTRKALANALAAAPSMWTLGNAGMGALQRLADDSHPAVAAAASKAIDELHRQWELQEGDSFTFVMNQAHQPDGPNRSAAD